MKEQITKAIGIKSRALSMRDSGEQNDLRKALALMDKAIGILKGLWEQRKDLINSPDHDASPDERDLVAALAETYGVKGGILRSLRNFEGAIDAYDEGFKFEQHRARKVDNSYNLIQRLTNRVLAEPHMAGNPEWRIVIKDEHGDKETKSMSQELGDARVNLHHQLTTSRGSDPWAAADMITIQLLLAPRKPLEGAGLVEEAYAKFRGLKPKPRVYESSLRAMKDLKDGLVQVPEGERSENLNVILARLDVITGWLREGLEEAKAQ